MHARQLSHYVTGRRRPSKATVEKIQSTLPLFGKVLGMSKDLILYEGETIGELRADFEAGIDSYIAGCLADGIEPRKPYSGTLNIRISSEMHSRIALLAGKKGVRGRGGGIRFRSWG